MKKKSKEIKGNFTLTIDYGGHDDSYHHMFNSKADAKEFFFEEVVQGYLDDAKEEFEEEWYKNLEAAIKAKDFKKCQDILYRDMRVNTYIT